MSRSGPCREYLAQLNSYLDGELTPAEQEVLRRHLESCPPCLTEYQRDELLKELMKRSCRCEQAPATLRTQILASIHVQVIEVRSDPRAG